MLIFQGSHDAITPPPQAKLLARVLAEAGVPVELQLFEGAGHGFTYEGAPAGPCCRYDAELTQRSALAIRDFVAQVAATISPGRVRRAGG